jgi:hypothetical protein
MRVNLGFESLLKSTPEDHAEHESISEALALVMEIAQANNDAIIYGASKPLRLYWAT